VVALDGQAEIDRGAPYLEVSEKTPMGSPFVNREAAGNRQAITALMARHGFRTYPVEFWHYNKGDAYDEYLGGSGRPARYGAVDFDATSGAARKIENAAAPLNADEELLSLIRMAMETKEPRKGPK
jgi:hypothetical protein